MRIYHAIDLEKYLMNDWIKSALNENMTKQETEIRTNKWLVEMDNKRMISADLYGDILKGNIDPETTVLDVGGGGKCSNKDSCGEL